MSLSILYLLIVVMLVVALVVFVVRWAEPRMAFHPRPGLTPPVAPYRRFEVTTADGILVSGWNPPMRPRGPIILYCCGNAGNLGDRTDLLSKASQAGLTVIAYNYRGTGESSGRPTEEGLYQDAIAVYGHLTNTLGISPSRIVVWGHSIGGAVAIELASRRTVAGLVVESTFRSGRSMARRMIPWLPTSLMMTYRFDNEATLPQLDLPLLFIHGTDDPFVPADDSRVLSTLVSECSELWLVEGASHNDIYEIAGEAFFSRIAEFAAIATNTESPRNGDTTQPHSDPTGLGGSRPMPIEKQTKTET